MNKVKKGKGKKGRRGSKPKRKNQKKGGSKKQQPLGKVSVEIQVDLTEALRDHTINRLVELYENKISKQIEQTTARKQEFQQLKEKYERDQLRLKQLIGKDDEIRDLGLSQKGILAEKRRKKEEMNIIEKELKLANNKLSEAVLQQTVEEELRRKPFFQGVCAECDSYIEETVSLYSDELYEDWSKSSLAMILLRSWQHKYDMLVKERKMVEEECLDKLAKLQSDFKQEEQYLLGVLNFRSEDNTELVVESANILHSIKEIEQTIQKTSKEMQDMCTIEEFKKMQEKKSHVLMEMDQRIAEANNQLESCRNRIMDDPEVQELEEKLCDMRKESRIEKEKIKKAEELMKKAVSDWQYYEKMYQTILNNLRFEYLPRLTKERETLQEQIQEKLTIQNDITKERNNLENEAARIDMDNRTLRIEVEDLTMDEIAHQNNIKNLESKITAKQTALKKILKKQKEMNEELREAEKSISNLKTFKERVSKKLKWMRADLKEKNKVFTFLKKRVEETHARLLDRLNFIQNFQKDLKTCNLQTNVYKFMQKFDNLLSNYSAGYHGDTIDL